VKEKIEALMIDKQVSFNTLASHFLCSKQTLTKKINGTLEWTYPEMMILGEVLGIEDLTAFFFSHQ